MVELAGKQLGAYTAETRIGQGGMAAVWKAYHPQTDRHVAIKVMLPDIAADPTFQQRFEREAKTLAGLQHVHILPVFDYGQQDDIAYLVMPFLSGRTLEDLIDENPPSPKEAARLFRQLASAMDYAHGKGILHRDIKPSNVMVDDSGNLLLADFGLTRLINDKHTAKLTSDSLVIGTPAYMSPEQGQGLDLDHRSDLYSLSVLLYEMLTGDVPYHAETPVAVIFKHIQEPLPIKDELPEAIANVLENALAKAPRDRYQSALEIAEALDAAIEGGVSLPPRKPKPADGELNTEQAQLAMAYAPTTGVEALDFAERMKDKRAPGESELDTQQAILEQDDAPTMGVENPMARGRARPKIKRGEGESRLWLVPAMLAAGVVAGLLVVGGVVSVLFLVPASTETSGAFGLSQMEPFLAIEAGEGGVLALALGEGDDLLMTGGENGLAHLWNVETGEQMYELEGHSADVNAVAISPDGDRMLTGGQDTMTYVWDTRFGDQQITNFAGNPVRDIAYSPSGDFSAYAASSQLIVSTTDTENFTMPVTFNNPDEAPFSALAFAPDEQFVLSGDLLGNLYLWDQTNPAEPELFQRGSEDTAVTSVAFSEDGGLVAASFDDGAVRVWDVGTFQIQRVLFFDFLDGATDVAFYPEDSDILAVAYEDGEVRLWSVEANNIIDNVVWHGDAISAIAFDDDGDVLAVASLDDMVTFWDLDG